MKIALLITGLLITTMYSNAQMGSWTIKINNKTLLATDKEDEKVNCKKIKSSQWQSVGNLEIIFKENEPDTWYRSFLFCDEDDNEIKRADSTIHSITSTKELRTLFQGKKKMIIYTVIAPVDPSIAIRIRRVHLCTLLLP